MKKLIFLLIFTLNFSALGYFSICPKDQTAKIEGLQNKLIRSYSKIETTLFAQSVKNKQITLELETQSIKNYIEQLDKLQKITACEEDKAMAKEGLLKAKIFLERIENNSSQNEELFSQNIENVEFLDT